MKRQFPRTWVPLASTYELDPDRPTPLQFLDQNYVCYKGDGDDDDWIVMDNVCPHRLVPLSEGRINRVSVVNENETDDATTATTTATTTTKSTIQCSYHGWEFDGSNNENGNGNCVKMPQATPELQAIAIQSPRSRVQTYSVRMHKNVVWFWPWTEDSLSILKEYPRKHPEGMIEGICNTPGADNDNSSSYTYTRDLPYGWDTLVENLIDPAHIPFAHHNLQGKRDDAIPIEMTVPESIINNENDGGEGGFFYEWQDRTMGKFRGGTGEFQAPFGVIYEGVYYDTKDEADAAGGTHIVAKRRKLKNNLQAGSKEQKEEEDNGIIIIEEVEFKLGVLCIPTKPGWSRLIIYKKEKKKNTTDKVTTTTTSTTSKKKKKKKKKSVFSLVFSVLPPWVMHLLSNKFLDSDLAFLHYQEQERMRYYNNNHNNHNHNNEDENDTAASSSTTSASSYYYMPAASDRCIAALRKWIPKHTDYLGSSSSITTTTTTGTKHKYKHTHKYTLPPPITSRSELFDRYKQHTSHCKHCQKGLKTLQTKVRRSAYGGLVVSVLAGHFLGVGASSFRFRGSFKLLTKVTALLSLGVLRLISKVELAFKQGDYKHYENH